MEDNAYASRLGLPESPGFFWLGDSALIVNQFDEAHGVGGITEYLNDIIDDFAALPMAIGRKTLILAELLHRRIRPDKISKCSSSILAKGIFTDGVGGLESNGSEIIGVRSIDDCYCFRLRSLMAALLVGLVDREQARTPAALGRLNLLDSDGVVEDLHVRIGQGGGD